jgi:hypothetical protein
LLTQRKVREATPPDEGYEWLWDEGGVPGFGVRVDAGGTKSYVVRHRAPNGKGRFKTLGRANILTLKAARDAAREVLVSVSRGEDPEPEPEDGDGLTFRDLCVRYLADWSKPRKRELARGYPSARVSVYGRGRVPAGTRGPALTGLAALVPGRGRGPQERPRRTPHRARGPRSHRGQPGPRVGPYSL